MKRYLHSLWELEGLPCGAAGRRERRRFAGLTGGLGAGRLADACFHKGTRSNTTFLRTVFEQVSLYSYIGGYNFEGRIDMQCPKCKNEKIERSKRRGFLEQGVYCLFGYYPWRCEGCRERFLLRVQYKKKVRLQPKD